MARKTNAFVGWVGSLFKGGRTAPPQGTTSPDTRSLEQRLASRFEEMMQEVDELSSEKYSTEERVEYGVVSSVRFLLPLVFCCAFGYEDGLFMTGFRDFAFVSSIWIMYVIGYGLEGLRTSLVYSMSFSRTEGRERMFRQQFIFWIIMSLGCGVAQLASALVIQALGGDNAVAGSTAISQGAQLIMTRIPWLVYLAIGIRVGLCAVADWACSGFLHKKRKTIEQKVTEITTRASHLTTIVQANLNANAMIDNAQQFQKMIAEQSTELKQLRGQQQSVFNKVFQAGMNQVDRVIEADDSPKLKGPYDE